MGYTEWNCACVLSVMGTCYEPLCYSQTSFPVFIATRASYPPSFSREFHLGWDVGKSVLALVHRRRN